MRKRQDLLFENKELTVPSSMHTHCAFLAPTGDAEVDLMEELLDSAENFDDELNDVADDKASKCFVLRYS